MRKIWHCVKKQIDHHQRIRQRHIVFLGIGQGIEIDVWPRQKRGWWNNGRWLRKRCTGDQVIDGQVFRWKRGQVFKKKCSGEKRRQGRHLQRLPVFPPENAGAVAFLCQALEHLAPIFRWQKKQICQLVPSLHFEGYAFWITCIWAWRPMSMICSAGTKSAIIGSSNLDKSRSMD